MPANAHYSIVVYCSYKQAAEDGINKRRWKERLS